MKAILTIDMPESCGPCRFSTRGTHPFCIATDRTHLVDISKGDRPSWCPLKEMPTVDVIPVEWIEEWYRKKAEKPFVADDVSVRLLLRDWREEQC